MINMKFAGAALTSALLLTGCTNDRPSTPGTTAAGAAGTTAGSTTAGSTTGAGTTAGSTTAAVACSLGQVRFGKVKKSYQLMGVSPATTVTSPSGGELADPNTVVHSRTAEVQAGAEVPREYVYSKLAPVIGKDLALPAYGTVYAPPTGDKMEVHVSGTFVTYEGLKTIDVPFTYECGGSTSSGTVTTWLVTAFGVVNCTDPIARNDPARAAVVEAASLRC